MTKPFPYVTRHIRVSADNKDLSLDGGKGLAVEEQKVRVSYMCRKAVLSALLKFLILLLFLYALDRREAPIPF